MNHATGWCVDWCCTWYWPWWKYLATDHWAASGDLNGRVARGSHSDCPHWNKRNFFSGSGPLIRWLFWADWMNGTDRSSSFFTLPFASFVGGKERAGRWRARKWICSIRWPENGTVRAHHLETGLVWRRLRCDGFSASPCAGPVLRKRANSFEYFCLVSLRAATSDVRTDVAAERKLVVQPAPSHGHLLVGAPIIPKWPALLFTLAFK